MTGSILVQTELNAKIKLLDALNIEPERLSAGKYDDLMGCEGSENRNIALLCQMQAKNEK